MSEVIQGSDEWRLARCGSLGASQIADMMARTKSGWGASRTNLAAQLVVERLTGQPTETYKNAAMQWGNDNEADARVAYCYRTDKTVEEVGIVPHPTIAGTHASPDGLVEDDGLVELKCPLSATHIETLLGDTVPSKYVLQVQWQLACTGRQWCDLVSYDPRMPEAMQLAVFHVKRDDKQIADLENHARAFVAGIDATVKLLRSRYLGEPA